MDYVQALMNCSPQLTPSHRKFCNWTLMSSYTWTYSTLWSGYNSKENPLKDATEIQGEMLVTSSALWAGINLVVSPWPSNGAIDKMLTPHSNGIWRTNTLSTTLSLSLSLSSRSSADLSKTDRGTERECNGKAWEKEERESGTDPRPTVCLPESVRP